MELIRTGCPPTTCTIALTQVPGPSYPGRGDSDDQTTHVCMRVACGVRQTREVPRREQRLRSTVVCTVASTPVHYSVLISPHKAVKPYSPSRTRREYSVVAHMHALRLYRLWSQDQETNEDTHTTYGWCRLFETEVRARHCLSP